MIIISYYTVMLSCLSKSFLQQRDKGITKISKKLFILIRGITSFNYLFTTNFFKIS